MCSGYCQNSLQHMAVAAEVVVACTKASAAAQAFVGTETARIGHFVDNFAAPFVGHWPDLDR